MPELNLTRKQLASFLVDQESIRKFEKLFNVVVENASVLEELVALVYSLGDNPVDKHEDTYQFCDNSNKFTNNIEYIKDILYQLQDVSKNFALLSRRIDSLETLLFNSEHSNYVHRSHNERIRGLKTFTKNNNNAPASSSDVITSFVGNDSAKAAVELTAFTGYPELWFRSHGGSALTPSAVTSGYYLASIRGYGYTGSGYNGSTAIIFYTNEAWSGSGYGSGIALNVTVTGYSTVLPIVFSAERIGSDDCIRVSADNLRIFNSKFAIFGATPVVKQSKSTPYTGITLTGHGSVWDATEAAIANNNYNYIAAALATIDNRVTTIENALIAYGALA